MPLGKPDCQTSSGVDAYIKQGSNLCILVLMGLNIFDPPPVGEKFIIPKQISEDAESIKKNFAELSRICARCPALAQAFPNVPKALGV